MEMMQNNGQGADFMKNFQNLSYLYIIRSK